MAVVLCFYFEVLECVSFFHILELMCLSPMKEKKKKKNKMTIIYPMVGKFATLTLAPPLA